MLALAALALGAALVFVALVVEAFLGAALAVVGLVSVFLGLPAVFAPAGLAALVVFYRGVSEAYIEKGLGTECTLALGFFSLAEAEAGFAAGSFLASFTVPDGPGLLLAEKTATFAR